MGKNITLRCPSRNGGTISISVRRTSRQRRLSAAPVHPRRGVAQCADMGFRFRRSFRVAPGLRLNLARSGISTSLGRRGAWLTFGPRGMRATVGLPGTGLSYSEQSPWRRPKPAVQVVAPGIEVAELPRVEIDVPPVPEAKPASHPPSKPDAEDVTQADPRLLKIALAIVGLVAASAVLWALLV